MIKKLLFLGLLSCGIANLKAVVAVGDTPNSSTTFSFSVGSAIYNAQSQQLWTFSGQDTSSFSPGIQSYGISYTQFIPVDGSLDVTLRAYPYLTSQAFITTTDGGGEPVIPTNPVVNPLLGQAFGSVTYLNNFITVFNSLTPQYIYLIQSVYFSDGPALGTVSPEGISIINQLDLGAPNQAVALGGSGYGVVFIANAQGTFGVASSQISFASIATTSAVINEQNTNCTVMTKQADEPLSVSTPVLTAGGANLASIGSSVVMYPSLVVALQMYIGLDVVAGAGSQAVGLFTAVANQRTETTPASITFGSVLPDGIGQNATQTPVSTTAGNEIMVSNITTTTTSTGLSYLISSRYNGIDSQSIYAMPMVTMASSVFDNGMIADFNSIKQTFQIIGTTYRVQGFDTVISDITQIDIAGSADVLARIQVGGAPVPLLPGEFIEQLTAQGDAVYITIQTPFGAGSTPGMFKSQALFDAQGRIMSWSPWQRVAGTDDQMIFAIKNRFTDATMYVSGASSNTIQQTVWNNNTDLTSFITAINAAMPVYNGGVQGLFPISNQTPGLSNFTLAVATGNQAVVIAQTGSLDGNSNVIIDSPQNIVTIDTELGLNIGSVVAATFANDGGNNWFFMGGSNGLSVLSNDTTGIGFSGSLTSLASLTAPGMSCKTLGNFKYIKKLVSWNGFLYVLTPAEVYQIALVPGKFTLTSPATLNAQLVVAASTIDRSASCLDMLIDNNLMLLGTTAGLYSLDVSGSLPVTPVSIPIPGGLLAVSRLNTISNSSNFDQGFYDSSNLYVLTINYAVQQARLNRFTITNGVVSPIQDQLLPGQNGPLLIFDYMSNNIFIDGSLGFATSYRIGATPPIVKYMQFTLQAGRSSTQILLQASSSDLSIAAVINSLGITAIARDYASGCLMLAADFGLLTDS